VQNGRFLTIARILRPQGRKGEVAAEILTDFPERFRQLQSVYLEAPGEGSESFQVEHAWPHKGQIILKFRGTDTIESAARLRGRQVLIPWEDRTPLPPHHYYLCELRGCRVVRKFPEREIGTVTEVEATGGVDVLHVTPPDGKGEVLIPLAQEICTEIDLSSRTIVIEPPEDLLEVNLSDREKGSEL
jgi:16S rRNA processing protein RimM